MDLKPSLLIAKGLSAGQVDLLGTLLGAVRSIFRAHERFLIIAQDSFGVLRSIRPPKLLV